MSQHLLPVTLFMSGITFTLFLWQQNEVAMAVVMLSI